MSPTLESGDDVLVSKSGRIRVGDIVVARHPYRTQTLLIKRVYALDDEGRLDLRGDAGAASSDSRTLGLFPRERVIGRVTCLL